jgi:CRP-like cAMP-binding protein
MYWAIQVTTGIGGDINPDSNTQVALTIVAIVWGLLMFASVIGAMSSAVAALDAKGIQRTQALDKIRSYMSRRNIGRQVQNEIVNYYSFLLNANHDDDDSIDLTKLPVLLQIKLELALKHQKVKTIPLFRGLEPFAILTIVQNLRSFIALPTQLLFTADTHGSTMYVLDRGCVHLSLPQSMARITIGSPHKDKASDDFGALFPAGGLRPKRRNRSMYNMYAGGAAGPPVGGVRDAVPKEVEEAWRLALCDYEATSHGTISIEVLKLQGDYFGENTMLGQAHYTSARSEAYSELFALGFENMEHAVREFPKLAVRCARAVQMRRKRVKAAISVFLARQYTKSQGAAKDAPSSQGLVMFEEKMSAAQTIQTWWENVNRDLDAEDILDLSDDDGDDGGDTKFKRSDIASLRDLRKTLTNIAPPVFSKGAPAAASDAAVSDASPAAAAAGAVVESADGSSVTIGRDEYAKLNDLLEKLHKSVETAERAKTEALREAPLEDHRQTLSRRRTTRLSVMQRSRIDEDGAYDAEAEQRTPRSRAGTRQGTGFQRPSQFPRHATGVAKRSMVSGGGRQFGSAPAMSGGRTSTAGRVKVVAPREGGLAEVQPHRRGPASELGLVHPVADVEDAKDA